MAAPITDGPRRRMSSGEDKERDEDNFRDIVYKRQDDHNIAQSLRLISNRTFQHFRKRRTRVKSRRKSYGGHRQLFKFTSGGTKAADEMQTCSTRRLLAEIDAGSGNIPDVTRMMTRQSTRTRTGLCVLVGHVEIQLPSFNIVRLLSQEHDPDKTRRYKYNAQEPPHTRAEKFASPNFFPHRITPVFLRSPLASRLIIAYIKNQNPSLLKFQYISSNHLTCAILPPRYTPVR